MILLFYNDAQGLRSLCLGGLTISFARPSGRKNRRENLSTIGGDLAVTKWFYAFYGFDCQARASLKFL